MHGGEERNRESSNGNINRISREEKWRIIFADPSMVQNPIGTLGSEDEASVHLPTRQDMFVHYWIAVPAAIPHIELFVVKVEQFLLGLVQLPIVGLHQLCLYLALSFATPFHCRHCYLLYPPTSSELACQRAIAGPLGLCLCHVSRGLSYILWGPSTLLYWIHSIFSNSKRVDTMICCCNPFLNEGSPIMSTAFLGDQSSKLDGPAIDGGVGYCHLLEPVLLPQLLLYILVDVIPSTSHLQSYFSWIAPLLVAMLSLNKEVAFVALKNTTIIKSHGIAQKQVQLSLVGEEKGFWRVLAEPPSMMKAHLQMEENQGASYH